MRREARPAQTSRLVIWQKSPDKAVAVSIKINLYTTNPHGEVFYLDCIEAALQISRLLSSNNLQSNHNVEITIDDIRICPEVYPSSFEQPFIPASTEVELGFKRQGMNTGLASRLVRTRRVVDTDSIRVTINQHALQPNAVPRWIRAFFYCKALASVSAALFLRGISKELSTHLVTSVGYRDVVLGDLVASYNARIHPKRPGLLSLDSFFVRGLYGAQLSAYILDRLCLDASTHNVAYTAEHPYINTIMSRVLSRRNIPILNHMAWNAIVGFYDGRVVKNPCAPQLSPLPISNDFSEVHDYMKVRLYSSSDPLGYMHLGKNENSEEGLRDIHDCRVEVDNELMNVVIFLHSFDDGLYIYGVPPFGDMYSWACFSIRQCIGNPKIGKVLVKPHPSLEYGEGPNRTLLAKMASEFSGFDKCIFIQPRSSLVALSRVKHIVGITSHGSVAEDFSYLGRLVIGSVYSPWQDNFRFLRTWKTIADYAHMLDRLSSRSRSHLDWAEWLELLNYVNTFRINGTSDAKKLYSTRFGKAVTGCECTGMSDAEFFPIANSHLAAKDDWLEITRSLSIVLVNRTA